MTGYRLHIDLPLDGDEDNSILQAFQLIEGFKSVLVGTNFTGDFNFRLGHDEDRQKSNYLDKNINGHVSNKKSRIIISG